MREKSNKVYSQSSKLATMSDTKKPITHATGVAAYPDKTTGSEVASKVRKEANKWSEEKRAALFDQGMRIIYGGHRTTEKVRSR
jgi:hypothetical protein